LPSKSEGKASEMKKTPPKKDIGSEVEGEEGEPTSEPKIVYNEKTTVKQRSKIFLKKLNFFFFDIFILSGKKYKFIAE